MADNSGNHDKGSMDISEQETTYGGFMLMTKIGTLITGALVMWLVMWLSIGFGWLPALAITIIASVVIGYLFS